MLGIDDILKRIQSFTFSQWNVRYKQLSPYKCAIHGFINSAENEIQCEICNEKIKIEDPYEGTYDVDKVFELVTHYKTQLRIKHAEECFFYNQDHPQKITTEYLYQEWRMHYRSNLYSYGTGNQEGIELPILHPQVKTYIGEQSLDIISSKTSLVESSIVDVPKILSIFGWKYNKGSRIGQSFEDDEEAPKPSLKCDFCGRNISILAYKTLIGKMQNLAEVEEISESREKKFIPLFDPLQEHKYFCRWGRPRNTDITKQYGWTICVEMLRYTALTEGRESKDGRLIQEEGKTQENIEEEKAHASILAEQTKLKLEIMGKMQELKNIKEKTVKKCEDIIKSSDKLGLTESKKYSEMIEHHRTKLDDLIQELDLKVDPVKKVKDDDKKQA